MERCGISEDTIIGQACQLISGTEKESCYLWREAHLEPAETINLLEPLVKQHPGCLFQKYTLEYIRQQKESGMSPPEKGPEDGSNRHQDTIASLLRLPGNLSDLVGELRRLNNNLESLPTGLDDKVEELTKVLEDFRTMIAPLLGWRVKKDSPEERNQ